MGKKARKTRWRALAVDTGNQSDREESNAQVTQNNKTNSSQNHHYNNNYQNSNSNNSNHQHHSNYQQAQHYGGVQRSYRAGSRFESSQSTNSARGRFGHYFRDHQHHQYQQQQQNHHNDADVGSKTMSKTTTTTATTTTTTTTNSTDNKITFNEDEYTRITTPRQDVLFKKGYLSKPKTYQTQTSTGNSTISTGNSTGNGTPDHQSADGTEGTDLEYESQFVFPNGFVDQNGIYYINSYEPYPPLVVYNPPLCYPEFVPSTRSKRLSTGSLTESTSPHNDETSQELSHSGGETVNNFPEYGSQLYLVPSYFYGNGTVPQEIELSHCEPRKIKKRRRRKLSKPVPEDNWSTSSSDEYDESDEMMSEIENRIIQGTHRPPTVDTPPKGDDDSATISSVTHKSENKLTSNGTIPQNKKENVEGPKTKTLKPDAKEFVPRSYIHRHHQVSPPFIANLIPLPPPFLSPPPVHIPSQPPLQPHLPNVAVIPPPHPTSLPVNAISTQTVQNNNESDETKRQEEVVPETTEPQQIQEELQEKVSTSGILMQAAEASKGKGKNVDIAKIVSKLEEAAKEHRVKLQKPRPKRRPLAVELNVNTKETTIKVDTICSKNVFAQNSSKNYAQMLRNKYSEVRHQNTQTATPPSPLRNQGKSLTAETVIVSKVARHLQAPTQKIQNQWIPVHSRKKRKNNKNSQEADWEDTEDETTKIDTVTTTGAVVPLAEDGFEAYDVSKLEDVVVAEVYEISTEFTESKEDNKQKVPESAIITTIANVSETLKFEVDLDPLSKTLPKMSESQKAAEEVEFDKLIKTLEELEAKTPLKKKAKNYVSKRVIVTDITEIAQAIKMEDKDKSLVMKKPKNVVEVPKSKTSKVKPKEVKETVKESNIEVVQTSPSSVLEVVDNLSKISSSISITSNVTVTSGGINKPELNVKITNENLKDDLPNILEKPPVNVAEADAQISIADETIISHDRDIFSNEMIEEVNEVLPRPTPSSETQTFGETIESPEKKRKKKKKSTKKLPLSIGEVQSLNSSEANYDFLLKNSLVEDERTNVEIGEELDKIIQRGMYSCLEEKIKSLNITAANDGFFKSMSLKSSNSGKKSKEDDLTSILTNTTNIFKGKRTLSHHQNAPTTTGSFLDVANIQQDPGIDYDLSTVGMDEYPITRAVKDWMVRTRESTPDVELLKSPKTILKELTAPIEEENIPLDEGVAAVKELWSLTPESSFDDDLLECWEDLDDGAKIVPDDGNLDSANRFDLGVEVSSEGEALDVYESMYGKNEDFKKIKEEIEEKRRNGTLPKHGQLPYRAICCSLM